MGSYGGRERDRGGSAGPEATEMARKGRLRLRGSDACKAGPGVRGVVWRNTPCFEGR